MTETSRRLGRPPKYSSPEELAEAIESYFDSVDGVPTIAGLSRAVGVTRQTLLNYKGYGEEFDAVVTDAKSRVEMAVEHSLLNSQKNVTGAIFWLKNNAGWKDEKTAVLEGGDKPLMTEIRIVLVDGTAHP